MKTNFATIVKRAGTKTTAALLLCTATCVLGLTACAQIKSWVTRPGTVEVLRPATTNFVTIITTNATVTPVQTNLATGEVTPSTINFQLSTNLTPIIQPAVLFTNLDLAPIVSSGISAADTAASAAGIPWSHTVAEILMAGIGTLLTWTNFRNRRKLLAAFDDHAETQSSLAIAQDVARTLVQNFEQLRQVALTIPGYTRQIDDKVMTAIQVAQQIAGVKTEINTLVDDHTNPTIPG